MTLKKKVLIVEDEPQWISLVKEELKENFDLKISTSFSDAKDIISSDIKLDAMLLDIMLPPNKNNQNKKSNAGIKLIELLFAHKGHDIPVIVFSGYLQKFRDEITNLGVKSFINKSELNPGDLLEIISQTIKDSESKFSEKNYQIQFQDVKKILEENIEKYADVRARNIHLPIEGNFELIKPLVGYKEDIEKKISQFPYEKNVFLMMKFRESNKEISDFMIENLQSQGFRGIRADDPQWNITHNVYNPIAVLYCCKYGIALFDEPEKPQAYSPNVAYELGMMHCQHKECLILKHSKLPPVPFDLIKDLYKEYKSDLGVRKHILTWLDQVKS